MSQSAWRPSSGDIDVGERVNALQVVSEALDMHVSPPQQQQDDDHIIQDYADRPQTPEPRNFGARTIVASDSDVSNGFVKSGRSLPYVFEATESGARKRSSKILPVCAVCGKRFVCVTTMKRHLVTHTGEKPFSCKVCGKQYTQKGNLRVHERTHRNDRPFECNICHQKFYRKEPMQKHQWRQHGIVHFKSRPGTQDQPEPVQTPAPPSSVAAAAAPLRKVEVPPPRPLIPVRPAPPTSYTALVDSLKASRENSPYRSSLDPGNAPPPDHHSIHHRQEVVPKPIKVVEESVSKFAYSSILNESVSPPNSHLLEVATPSTSSSSSSSMEPIKLKMKLAYQKEVESELREMKLQEMVEWECKTCGNTFSVSDPYNFRCTNCHVKYTSLPTHLIADPLQCIGCAAVFPHKPALKAHQTREGDKERPFRCCKCGYSFRQKAHLQKHQWRIHRRRLDSDSESPGSTMITMQDIINKSVEKSANSTTNEPPTTDLMKTSSKYYSEVMGLEYEPKSEEDEEEEGNHHHRAEEEEEEKPLDLSPMKKVEDHTSADHLQPAWKKAKTEAVHHTSLPPISGLVQSPLALVTYKHSSWVSSERSADVSSAPVNLKHNNNNFVRSQMELVRCTNARTV